jgi:solute carrier family 35 protein F1/2
LDDDDSPARRIRLFSLRRKDDDDDDDDRRRRLRAAEERRRRRHHHRSRGVGASRGERLRSSRPTHPLLFGLFEIRARWYYYLGVALVEAQAFYFIFLAFRYTTFTFVYVSDALAIPSAMLFSKMIMKRRYLWTHLLGCAICISGIVVNTASDLDGDGEGGGVRHSLEHIKGDVFAIIGAILLGLDDVLSEIIVNDYGGVNEMLFMKGLFGALISVVQLAVFERDDVLALFGDEGACDLDWRMMLFATHFGTRALSVAGEMQFLYMSEAALLNILLLTSDLFAAIFDVEENGLRLSPYFYAAFACIVIGIVLYEAGPSPAEQHAVTPLAIEFHCREKKVGHSVVVPSSASTTEHAGNLSKDVDAEFT